MCLCYLPILCPGQVRYLIVSIPDLCHLGYFCQELLHLVAFSPAKLFCVWSLLCDAALNVFCRFAIFSPRKREQATLLNFVIVNVLCIHWRTPITQVTHLRKINSNI